MTLAVNAKYFESFSQDPEYILHAFWSADIGLALWLEQVAGHKIVVPKMLPEHAFPPFIMNFLAGLKTPRKYKVALLTTKGREVVLEMPVYALAPERAADFLYAIALLNPQLVAAEPEPGQRRIWTEAQAFAKQAQERGLLTVPVAVLDDAGEDAAGDAAETATTADGAATAPATEADFVTSQLDQGVAVAIDEVAEFQNSAAKITAEQAPPTWGIGQDLRWLAHFRAGLGRFACSGNVGISMMQADRAWYPQWKLQLGVAESTWVSQMVQAAPGILHANFSGHLGDALLAELGPWVVNSVLQPLIAHPRSHSWQSFVRALVHGTAYPYANARMLQQLSAWNSSVQADDVAFVLQLECVSDLLDELDLEGNLNESPAVPGLADIRPASSELTDAPTTASGETTTAPTAAGEQQAPVEQASLSDAQAVWVVRSAVQIEGMGVEPINLAHLSGNVRHQVLAKHDSLLQIPLLDPDRLVPADSYLFQPWALQQIQIDRRGEQAGPWDVYLTTAEVMELLQDYTASLSRKGVRILVPSDWASGPVKAKVQANVSQARDAVLGFDSLLNFNWEIAIGDTSISPSEMRELLESSGNLVRFKGKWMYADKDALHYYQETVAKFEKQAQDELDARLEELQELYATVGDDPLAREYLDQQREVLSQALETGGSVANLGFLRALSLEQQGAVTVEAPGWQQALLGGVEALDTGDHSLTMPDSLQANLREYQQAGVEWLYWMGQRGIGAILADDMGLGKTLQIIALELYERNQAQAAGETVLPTLVVCPTSLLVNWQSEFQKFAPSLRTVIHHGAQRLEGLQLHQQWRDADVVITSYGMVVSDFADMQSQLFRRLVVDEAQKMKNPRTKIYKVISKVPAQHRVALSGTPVENNLLELHALMNFCNPSALGSRKFFMANFATPIERYEDKDRLEMLRRFSDPFILRRTKLDPAIRGELPDKQEVVLQVSLTPEQAALYQAYNDEVLRKIQERTQPVPSIIFQSLTAYKQICNHPAHYLKDKSGFLRKGEHRSGKVAAAMTVLGEALEQGKKVLIFTQFVEFARLLQTYLSSHFRTEVPLLYGQVSAKQRAIMVDHFQNDAGVSIMILTHGSGGVGLNLTAASVVIHMDRWWNPAVENQATDRAYRIGQDKEVTVYKMVTKGTIEEHIDELIRRKQELAAEVIAGGEHWLSQLSADELTELLSFHNDGSNHLGNLRQEGWNG